MKKIVTPLFLMLTLFLSAVDGKVTIFQTTDVHGSMGVCDDKPGIAGIGNIIRTAEQKISFTKPFILIDCGDLTQGSFAASLDYGKQMIDAINTLGYDVWVPGNHDYDFGAPQLKKRIASFKGVTLAANLRFTNEEIQPHKPWIIFTRLGVKIAVIGITPPYLDQWIGAAQLKGVETRDVFETLREIMPSVMKEKPDVIILAIHLGKFISGRLNADGKTRSMATLAAEFPQIDLILGGHTHETVSGEKLGNGAWFVQAPPLSDGAAEIHINIKDGKKEITSRMIAASRENEAQCVVNVLSEVRERAGKLARAKVADIPFELAPVKTARRKNHLADILAEGIARASGSELAFSTTLSNYTFKGGKITAFQVFLLAPYENYISTIEITPDEAKTIFEEQADLKSQKVFMHAYGVEYDGKILKVGGQEWKAGRKKCAFGSYAISGAGGRYPKLKSIAESGAVNRIDTLLTVRSALYEELRLRSDR